MIWWCAEHRSGESAEEGTCEVAALLMELRNWTMGNSPNYPPLESCSMVEALLIVKENGLWKLPFAIWPRDASIQTILDRLADPIASVGEQ